MSDPIDLDRLSHLEEERRFLLRSITDLEAEFAVGDISESDYRELHDSYVSRAANCLREIEAVATGHGAEPDGESDTPEPKRSRRGLVTAASVMVFAVLAGVLLAQASGSRGAGESLTGTIDDGRDQFVSCQSTADMSEAISCYDEILKDAPKDLDALTYKGWALYRSGDREAGTKLFEQVILTDQDYPDVYVFRAVAYKDEQKFAEAQTMLDQLWSLNPPSGVTSTLTQMGLDTDIALGLLPSEVAACWSQEAEALDGYNIAILAANNSVTDDEAVAAREDLTKAAAELLVAVDCFDTVLEATPNQVDALIMKALGLSVLRDDASMAEALTSLDRAVIVDPDNSDARLIRAAVSNMSGDPSSAADDLELVDDVAVSPLYRNIDIAAIRDEVASQLREADR